jgi:hypothetical protein
MHIFKQRQPFSLPGDPRRVEPGGVEFYRDEPFVTDEALFRLTLV